MDGAMAMVLVLITMALVLPAQAGRPHISNLNVLLPPKTAIPVRYRLQGTDGCFVWTWDHHDIISLEAEYNATANGCSTSAIITPVAPFDERQATAVHATDTITGEVLRCEVFVDKISRIQIFHHSVKLDLDGWATLRIRAFDAEDNVFSSLAGLRFKWQLSAAGVGLPQRLLYVPLKDSPLSDKNIDTQIALEENGFGSDLFVVRGVSAGQETVRARVVEPNMEDLEDMLVLTVAEAISLEPHSPLYVIPGTQFRFRLRAMRQNVLTEIALPSPYHEWSVTNTTVALVDRHNAVIAAKTVGTTNIIVEDIRVKGHHQIATLHVVIPTSLELYLFALDDQVVPFRFPLDGKSSGGTWYVVVGREYVVEVKAYSSESGTRPLYLTQSNDLRLLFTYMPYWEAVEIPEAVAHEHGLQNATLLKALEEGAGSLIAKLVYENEGEVMILKMEQLVTVCSPVLVALEKAEKSRIVFLPWSIGSSQEYQLKAEGGCGDKSNDYVWSSSNPSVASVNAVGKLLTKGPGKIVIRASSSKDLLNFDEVQVEVSVPSSIAAVQGIPVEVEVGTVLPVAVSLLTPTGLPYTRCDAYNSLVQWELLGGDGNLKFVDSSAPYKLSDMVPYTQGTCAWNKLIPMRPGRATVTASVKVSTLNTPTLLETSWTVASYAPLTFTQVGDGNCCGGYSCTGDSSVCHNLKELYLVIGSSIKVTLTGGPERWRQGSTFVEYHELYSDESGEKTLDEVSVARAADGGGRVFYIRCSGFGKYTLVFRRGYQETEAIVNIVASASLLVICGVPSSLVLVIDEKDNNILNIKSAIQLERDKDRKRVIPVTVINDRVIRVAAVALHMSGKPFANASSMGVSWDLEDCDHLAHWEYDQESWEQRLVLQNTVGLCAVRATLTHFKPSNIPASTFTAAASVLKQAKPYLSDAGQLQLVTALRLEPKEILLFSHPDAKETLQVLGGTNYIEPSINDSRVAVVIPSPIEARVPRLVVTAGAKGTALISVRDIGLASPASAAALVHVADIARIRLSPEEISLELGKAVEVQLQVDDVNGRVFDPSQYVLFNIRIHVQDEVIELVNQTSNQISGNSFFIKGSDIGLTSFHVSALQASGREIHSEIIKVEVYAPLYIHPSPLVLTPGAQFLLAVLGGPRSGIVVEFSSSNSLVATVERNTGLVIAKSIGNEVIYAKAHDHDGNVLGEAFTEITVSVPVSMFLEVRGGQLGIGREMSIFPVSNEGNLFSFYEMCGNYEWEVSDEAVLELKSVKPSSLSEEESASTWPLDTGFSARITGKSAGKAMVTVTFVCHFQDMDPRNYKAMEMVSVLPDPPLAMGMCATLVFPPNHRSSTILPQRTLDRLSQSSRAISYTMMHDGGDVLSINEGRIYTGDRIDVGCIHARDRVAGRSEVAVCIRVAEVAQMTVGDDSFPFHVSEVSVGTQHSFTVMLRDNIGTPFNEVDLPLSVETNRADVVSVKATSIDVTGASSKLTIVTQALRQGKALIRISQKQKEKVDVADYILVMVGAYVYPRNPVMHIGDKVNLSIAGKGGMSSLERGQWSSGNPSVVRVNSRTGEAEAISEGSTLVSFNGPRLTAHTSVTVARIASITVEAPKLQFLTNVPFPEQGYRFPVIFTDTYGRDASVAGENRAISYDCKVSPSFIGRAAPWHDSGASYCIFYPYIPEKIAFNIHREFKSKNQVSEVGDANGELRMTLSAIVMKTPDVYGAATVPFIGGFTIINTPPQLQLSSKSNKSRIEVVGSVGALTVSWKRKDLMHVRTVTSTPELGVGGNAVYEILLLEEDQSFTDTLVFMLSTTGQREEVPLSYSPGNLYGAAYLQQIFTTAIITLLGVVVPVFICTKLLDFPRRPFIATRRSPSMVSQIQEDGGVLLNGEADNAVHTPVQFKAFTRSPPKPYTEYVSRTIEHTPYYSRQDIRRSDPSRTY